MAKKVLVVVFIMGSSTLSKAQSDQQVWLEYMLTHPFANSWELEHDVRYSTTLTSPHWRAFRYYPTLSWAFSENIDFLGGLTFAYNFQEDAANTIELREMLGFRVHITPNRRILTRLLVRGENRNLQDTETKDWTSSNRLRMRGEALIPLNNPTMFNKDKLLYGIVDAEWFFAFDRDLNERFANRFRLRTGLGYRFNYNFRVEFIYSYQESRNQQDDANPVHDNIYRFRFRHFINKSNPSKNLGMGD